MSHRTKDARLVWNSLNGIFLIYKPPEVKFNKVRQTIIKNLCRDLNAMEIRSAIKFVAVNGPSNQKMEVIVRDSYADNLLVTGPRYEVEDFKLAGANMMSVESSGILVCGINLGIPIVHKLRQSKLPKFYRLKGLLGQARDNDFATGKIVEKSTWKHIKRHQIDHMCALLQGSHQRKMFEHCGIDIQSQDAYDIAVKGPIRPADSKVSMIYTVKCINFEPPQFTLEIMCINEDDTYLKALISEIGYRLKSTSHCTNIQCIQLGFFNITNSLLSKNWDLQNILQNMSQCQRILTEHPHILKQDHVHLESQTVQQ